VIVSTKLQKYVRYSSAEVRNGAQTNIQQKVSKDNHILGLKDQSGCEYSQQNRDMSD
jgi:hypothetical protein